MAAGRDGGAGVYISPFTAPVTDQFGDRLAHQVLDQHIAPSGVDGVLRTVCGEWIVPASMMEPIGMPCAACAAKIGCHVERVAPRRPRRRARA